MSFRRTATTATWYIGKRKLARSAQDELDRFILPGDELCLAGSLSSNHDLTCTQDGRTADAKVFRLTGFPVTTRPRAGSRYFKQMFTPGPYLFMNQIQREWMRVANSRKARKPSLLATHRAIGKAKQWSFGKPGKARGKISNTWRVENFTHRKMW